MLFILAAIALFFVLWGLLLLLEPALHGSLAHVSNWTTHFRYRDYLPVFVLLIAGALVTVFAGDAFIDLAELVHAKSPILQQIDAHVHDWAVSERNPGATTFFVVMSIIGGPVSLGIITALAATAFLVSHRYRWALYLAVTIGGGSLLLGELKLYFQRARPVLAEMLRRAHGYSFPSGHAMGSTIVMGAFAYLAVRSLKTWKQKSAAIAGAITFVVCVAISRVYLGVHWGSDIIAGVSAGLLWLATTTIGYETSRRIRLIRVLRQKRGVQDKAA